MNIHKVYGLFYVSYAVHFVSAENKNIPIGNIIFVIQNLVSSLSFFEKRNFKFCMMMLTKAPYFRVFLRIKQFQRRIVIRVDYYILFLIQKIISKLNIFCKHQNIFDDLLYVICYSIREKYEKVNGGY